MNFVWVGSFLPKCFFAFFEKIDRFVKDARIPSLSFRRKPESSHFKGLWTPASAGGTGFRNTYKVNERLKQNKRNERGFSLKKGLTGWAICL